MTFQLFIKNVINGSGLLGNTCAKAQRLELWPHPPPQARRPPGLSTGCATRHRESPPPGKCPVHGQGSLPRGTVPGHPLPPHRGSEPSKPSGPQRDVLSSRCLLLSRARSSPCLGWHLGPQVVMRGGCRREGWRQAGSLHHPDASSRSQLGALNFSLVLPLPTQVRADSEGGAPSPTGRPHFGHQPQVSVVLRSATLLLRRLLIRGSQQPPHKVQELARTTHRTQERLHLPMWFIIKGAEEQSDKEEGGLRPRGHGASLPPPAHPRLRARTRQH